MGMNIKSEEAHALARQIVRHTGESLPPAVVVPLKGRLERERNAQDKIRPIDEILARRPPVPEGVTRDHSDLYNDRGLPA